MVLKLVVCLVGRDIDGMKITINLTTPHLVGIFFEHFFPTTLSNKSKEAEMALLKGQPLAPEVMQLVNVRNGHLGGQWSCCCVSTLIQKC